MRNVIARAELLKPLGAAATGRNDDAVGLVFGAAAGQVDDNALANSIRDDEVLAAAAEDHLDPVVLQKMLELLVQLLRLLRAEVADRAVDKLQARRDGASADILDLVGLADTLDVRVGAELKVHGVRVVDERLRSVRADQLRKIAADLVAEG